MLTDQGSNGFTLDAKGRLILCQGGDRCVARLERDGKFTRLAERYKDRHFNSPNDVIIDSLGTIIFTDPPYGVPEGKREELDFHGVFVIIPGGRILPLIKNIRFPNGLALSPDEKTLYIAVSDPEQPRLIAYDFNPAVRMENNEAIPGVTNERLFFNAKPLCSAERQGLPDGMKVDSAGNVWDHGPGRCADYNQGGQTPWLHSHRPAHRQLRLWRRRLGLLHHRQHVPAAGEN